MSDETLNHTSTEEILASIRKIMSAEWEHPAAPKLSPLDPEDEDVLELTKKVEAIPKKESPTPSLSVSASPPSRSNQSAEDLLSSLLRPLLKEWLNQHLPSIIEKEIKKRSLS